MRIIGIRVGCLFNTGNYENQRFELEAALEDGDEVKDVADQLMERIHSLADRDDIYQDRRNAERELHALEKQVVEMREKWEAMADFMRAQGLKADIPEAPSVTVTKAIAAISETTQLVPDAVEN